jgi:hypothetical protein
MTDLRYGAVGEGEGGCRSESEEGDEEESGEEGDEEAEGVK